MMKFDKENIVQTASGDAITIGDCCDDKFQINIFGSTPRTAFQVIFTKAELKKLADIINRLSQ